VITLRHTGFPATRLQFGFAAISTVLAVLIGCNSHRDSRVPEITLQSTTRPAARPTTAPETYREADELKPRLAYLASDELEGRGVTTEGINKAADYIANAYRDAGLKTLPALNSSYFQPFELATSTALDPATTLTIGDKHLEASKAFTALGLSSEGEFSAPLAFAGYAISSEKYKYDDFAGLDATGKVLVALRYEPTKENDVSRFVPSGRSEDATFNAKARAAEKHGAAALIIVDMSLRPGAPDRLMPIGRSMGEQAGIPVLQLTRAAAVDLFSSLGKDLPALAKEIDTTGEPHSFVLGDVIASGKVALKREKRTVKNVVALLPGTGPQADEYVVVGAHYDHLGRGEPGSLARNNKEIHHGADDNGSGTVAIMEIAEKLAKQGPLPRSIIFASFTGEERGLIGSAEFVKHPPVPLEKIVAMLNLDMVGRIRNDTLFVGGAGTAGEFDRLLEDADGDSPLTLKTAGADVGARGGIGPSDHESFALKKIPVLFFYSGMHMDYHRPTDTADKINYVGIAEAVDLGTSVVERLAKLPRAQYVDKYDRSMGRSMGGSNVVLGIMPDYNADSSQPGVRVAGLVPEGAAQQAGVKEGDVIVGIAGDKVNSLGDYMTVLAKHKPSEKVKLNLLRDNQKVELEATLKARQG
jgi:hypothetical protein